MVGRGADGRQLFGAAFTRELTHLQTAEGLSATSGAVFLVGESGILRKTP